MYFPHISFILQVVRGFRPAIPTAWRGNETTRSSSSSSGSMRDSDSSAGSSNSHGFTSNGELDPIYIDILQMGTWCMLRELRSVS